MVPGAVGAPFNHPGLGQALPSLESFDRPLSIRAEGAINAVGIHIAAETLTDFG
jgi:hypothetical protein